MSYSRKKTKKFSLVNLTRAKHKDNDRKKPVRLPFKEAVHSHLHSFRLPVSFPFILKYEQITKTSRNLGKVSNMNERLKQIAKM